MKSKPLSKTKRRWIDSHYAAVYAGFQHWAEVHLACFRPEPDAGAVILPFDASETSDGMWSLNKGMHSQRVGATGLRLWDGHETGDPMDRYAGYLLPSHVHERAGGIFEPAFHGMIENRRRAMGSVSPEWVRRMVKGALALDRDTLVAYLESDGSKLDFFDLVHELEQRPQIHYFGKMTVFQTFWTAMRTVIEGREASYGGDGDVAPEPPCEDADFADWLQWGNAARLRIGNIIELGREPVLRFGDGARVFEIGTEMLPGVIFALGKPITSEWDVAFAEEDSAIWVLIDAESTVRALYIHGIDGAHPRFAVLDRVEGGSGRYHDEVVDLAITVVEQALGAGTSGEVRDRLRKGVPDGTYMLYRSDFYDDEFMTECSSTEVTFTGGIVGAVDRPAVTMQIERHCQDWAEDGEEVVLHMTNGLLDRKDGPARIVGDEATWFENGRRIRRPQALDDQI